MNEYLSRLNSLERRFVVGTALVVFILLNWIFIWPRFGDWNENEKRMEKARDTLAKYQKEISQKGKYQRLMAELGGDQIVPQEDQVIELLNTVQNQAVQSGVMVQGSTALPDRTNAFILERGRSFTIISGEPQLVDFLYNLSAGNSLIRVRDLTLRPQMPARQDLSATVKLVASYQKNPPRRGASDRGAKSAPKSSSSKAESPPGKTSPAGSTSKSKRP